MSTEYSLYYEAINWLQGILHSFISWIDEPLFVVSNIPITFFSILRFIFIIGITIWFSHLISNALTTLSGKRIGMGKSRVYRLKRLFEYSVLIIGFLIAITGIGFNFSSILVVIGALGVGLGFALQPIFLNFFAGLIILFESQLKVGDFVEIDNEIHGEILEINVRCTIIATNDGTEVIVPNSEIITHRIINWTLRHPYRRIHVPFRVAHGVDKEKMARVVIEAAKKVPKTLKNPNIPEPIVDFIKIGDSSLDFELAVWVNDLASKSSKTTNSDYLWVIDTALHANEIPIPYPQLELNVKRPKTHQKSAEHSS